MKSSALILSLVLLLSACSKRAILVDYDPTFDFSKVESVTVEYADDINVPASSENSDDQENSTNTVNTEIDQTSPYVREYLISKLEQANVQVNADSSAHLKISLSIEECVNDQVFSVGIGNVARRGNSSIGIGTTVNFPLGEDTVLFQVVELELIVGEQVVWTSNHAARLRSQNEERTEEVQKKLIDRLLEGFPLVTTGEGS